MNILKEIFDELKRKRRIEFAWCKCPENCVCDHCKPAKVELARKQLTEVFTEMGTKFEKAIADIERGKYPLRNQQHTLSDETIDEIIRELEEI